MYRIDFESEKNQYEMELNESNSRRIQDEVERNACGTELNQREMDENALEMKEIGRREDDIERNGGNRRNSCKTDEKRDENGKNGKNIAKIDKNDAEIDENVARINKNVDECDENVARYGRSGKNEDEVVENDENGEKIDESGQKLNKNDENRQKVEKNEENQQKIEKNDENFTETRKNANKSIENGDKTEKIYQILEHDSKPNENRQKIEKPERHVSRRASMDRIDEIEVEDEFTEIDLTKNDDQFDDTKKKKYEDVIEQHVKNHLQSIASESRIKWEKDIIFHEVGQPRGDVRLDENLERDGGVQLNEAPVDRMDHVLEEIGQFGTHQLFHLVLILVPIILSGTFDVNFIVTSATDEYRCRIPECDVNDNIEQNWLKNAIPHNEFDDRLLKCVRYNLVKVRPKYTDEFCPATVFNSSDIIPCNDFIFKTNEHRIMREFGIYCDENEYKLALVGTINNVAGFIFMPITGYLSDKYGRRTVLACASFACGIFGLIKAFVGSYPAFMAIEFIGAAFGSTIYCVSFILCIEWLPTRYRLLASTILAGVYPFGEILLGTMAMIFSHYRMFLVVIYAPAIPIILYLFIIPESPRWLHASGKHGEVLTALDMQAAQNGLVLSNQSIAFLSGPAHGGAQSSQEESANKRLTIWSIFKHRVLYLRLIACSIVWTLIVFIYYGISVKSTKFDDDDNKYLTYITTVTAEIPAAILTYLILDNVGRRKALCYTTVVAGACLITAAFMPPHHPAIIRAILFVGMMAEASAFTILYVFTAELWPTQFRSMLTNICAMVGRIGSIIAPLSVLMDQFEATLSVFVYGASAFTAACIVHLLPETKNKNLPQTIDDSRRL